MTVCGSHGEHIKQSAANAEFRILGDPHFDGNVVSRTESDAVQVFCQLIRIGIQDHIERRAVPLINAVGQIRAYAILLHIHDSVAHAAFHLRLLGNRHRHGFADAVDL